MGLIKLDYGVLAILSQADMSGYDITSRLNNFWKTTHSRIYPVLHKLEKLGHVTFEPVQQDKKPNKKVYHITESGVNALRNWLMRDPKPSNKRDDFLPKFISVHLLESDLVMSILKERIRLIKKEEDAILDVIEKAKLMSDDVVSDSSSNIFNIHLLTQNVLAHSRLEIQWCRWAIGLYKQKSADNFFDINFEPEFESYKNKED